MDLISEEKLAPVTRWYFDKKTFCITVCLIFIHFMISFVYNFVYKVLQLISSISLRIEIGRYAFKTTFDLLLLSTAMFICSSGQFLYGTNRFFQ